MIPTSRIDFVQRSLTCRVVATFWFVFLLTTSPVQAQNEPTGAKNSTQSRTWTSGKYSFEGRLVKKDGDQVTLKSTDGKVITVGIEKLSEADRDYLTSAAQSPPSSAGDVQEFKDALETFGLKISGNDLALIEEKAVKRSISNCTKIRKSLFDVARQVESVQIGLLEAKQKATTMEKQFVKLNSMLASARTTRENNQIVAKLNAANSTMKLHQTRIEEVEGLLKQGQTEANKQREAYIAQLLEVKEQSKALDTKIEELSNDGALKNLLADIETKTRTQYAIGASKTLERLRRDLKKLEDGVMSESIPLRDDGSGTFMASVSINENESVELVVDSGASSISLPASMAEQLGIYVGADAPDVRVQIADGSIIPGKLVILDSVRVGKFTAENVECVVLGPKAKAAPSLLGMSFLGKFKFELNANEGTLTMIDIPVE